MIKLEMIHNKEVLKILKGLVEESAIVSGFTSLSITDGFGPKHGEYMSNHLNEDHFLTIILTENDEEVNKIIDEVKVKLPLNTFLAYKSRIERIN